MKYRYNKSFKKYPKNILTIGSFILLSAVLAFFILQRVNKSSTTKDEPIISYSTSEPDESKQNATSYNWQGGANEPKKIVINEIGVDAYVQKSGIDQDNKIAVPSNVHLTGWYHKSVSPGNNGLSIIVGHVSGRTSSGVFKDLHKLDKGSTFTVEMGDGTIHSFTVSDTETVPEKDSAAVLFSQNPSISQQLTLVTCGGTFDPVTGLYEDRILVTARKT